LTHQSAGKLALGNEPIAAHDPAERPVGRSGDSDSRGDLDSVIGHWLTLANYHRLSLETLAAPRSSDSQRGAEFSGPVGEIDVALDAGTSAVHQRDAIERLESAHQNCARQALLARDGVEAPIHAIYEVHVREAGRTVQALGAARAAGCGVAGQVVLAEVCFGFDDDSAREAIRRLAFEDGPEHLARDDLRLAVVESGWKHAPAVKAGA